MLVTSHPSVRAHTGPDAVREAKADQKRFVEHLRELLRCAVETHRDHQVRLTLVPVSLTSPPVHPPIALPVEGESVDNLPYIFTKHLAKLTALEGDHEVIVDIEL